MYQIDTFRKIRNYLCVEEFGVGSSLIKMTWIYSSKKDVYFLIVADLHPKIQNRKL